MKHFFLIALLSCLFSSNICAQNSTGLVMENDRYQKVARLGFGMNFSTNKVAKVSLRPYCPTPLSQGSMGSCVGWATGFGALTVATAANKNITDLATINSMAHSALYVYNQIKVSGCNEGSRITDALELLQQKGDCKLTDFAPNDCNTTPSGQHDEVAANFRIKDYGTLFGLDASNDVKVSTTTQSIAQGKPVIVGMIVTNSFKQLRASFWQPLENETELGGHAMLVVGYDDKKQTFEIMNSWGTNWGDGGFFTLSYDNFAKYVKYGYQMNVPENKPNDNQKTVQLSGEFVFNKYNIEKSQAANTDIYEEVMPKLTNNYYTLPEGTCNTQTYFQLVAKNIKKDAYVYVFSVKPNAEVEVLYPTDKAFSKEAFGVTIKQLPRVIANNATITIPNPDSNSGMTTDLPGEDYLCILYSDKTIDDIQDIVINTQKAMAKGSNFNESLQTALGNRLMPTDKLNYDPNKMGVKAASTTGYIAPIILKVNVSEK